MLVFDSGSIKSSWSKVRRFKKVNLMHLINNINMLAEKNTGIDPQWCRTAKIILSIKEAT